MNTADDNLENNKALVREWLRAVIETGDDERVCRIMAPDCVDHDPAPGQAPGRAGHLAKLAYVRSVFSQRQLTIEHLIAEGPFVVDHWTFEGLHDGAPFLGAPATGARVRFRGIDIVRIVDGRITDIWHVEDFLSALQQVTTSQQALGGAA